MTGKLTAALETYKQWLARGKIELIWLTRKVTLEVFKTFVKYFFLKSPFAQQKPRDLKIEFNAS